MFNKRDLLLLVGGMGPMASSLFHQKLLSFNSDSRCDQDHLNILHVSVPSMIGDRTFFLLNDGVENPGRTYGDYLKALCEPLLSKHRYIYIVVPCATFHSKIIFDEFVSVLSADLENIRIFNFVDLTVQSIATSGKDSVSVMATIGSSKSLVWENAFNKHDVCICPNSEHFNNACNDLIYTVKSFTCPEEFKSLVTHPFFVRDIELLGDGECVLGCTELSLIKSYTNLLGEQFIDPFDIIISHYIFS